MHVEILPPVGKVKYLGQMITFVDQETTDVLGPRSPKSTRTIIPIISISAPTAPVRRSCHTDNCIRSPDMGHNKRTRKMLPRTAQRRMLRFIIQTKSKYKKQYGTGRETLATTKSAKETQEEISTNDECDHNSISFDDDEESTTSHEDNLEDWIEYVKRSTREADQKMLTFGITNWIDSHTEATEVATSLTNCNTKQRKMDQESG